MTGLEPNSAPHEPEPAPDPLPFVPEPAPRRPRWRLVGALLCFAAAILSLLGSFGTLFTATVQRSQNTQTVLTITGWDIHAESNGRSFPAGTVPDSGAPLVFAATILLAAALLGLVATALPARVGIGRANILLAAAGAAFLAGTTWSIGMQELNWLEIFSPSFLGSANGSANGAGDVGADVGLGYWMLIVATGAALVATVFAWVPARARPDRTEPDTPPLGVPVVVVHRLPDEPPDESK